MNTYVRRLTVPGREKERKIYKLRANIQAHNFEKGDFVLLKTSAKMGRKISYKWVRPKIVAGKITDLVYKVSDCYRTEKSNAHTRCIIFFRADMDEN